MTKTSNKDCTKSELTKSVRQHNGSEHLHGCIMSELGEAHAALLYALAG